MAVNVEALIRSLGKTYQEIFDAGLIPYKTKPTGFSGDPDLSLDMAREGIFLSFHRKDRVFTEITLTLLDDEKKSWVFPNELPSPLQQEMSRQWMHNTFGSPEKTSPPEIIMKRHFGWFELYIIEDFHIPLSMQISYDLHDMARTITFLPTSEVRW